MNDDVEFLERTYGLRLPEPYRRFIAESAFSTLGGRRAPPLPGWADSMRAPLCFDPEVVAEVFEDRARWGTDAALDGVLPFACFCEASNPHQLSGLDDFLAIDRVEPCRIWLWDHEGELREVAPSLERFVLLLGE